MSSLSAPLLVTLLALASCRGTKEADLVIYNARIYTVDSLFSVVEAMAVKEGKVLATGTSKEITAAYYSTNKINAGGAPVYPGLIDAHAHFLRYGLDLQNADLTGTESWDEVLRRLDSFRTTRRLPAGAWILGRGWDQNDWAVKEYPDRAELDRLFPDNPVLLTRVDGHAAIANGRALQAAALQAARPVTGGSIETKGGVLTGLLIDNAVDLVAARIPAADTAVLGRALLDAEQRCFAVGLTTVDDCGVGASTVDLVERLQKERRLRMKLYLMLSDEPANYDYLEKRGIIDEDRLTVRGFKLYGDGALGSRGACLLKPYSDRPDWTGFLLSQPSHFDSMAARISARNFQMCTHAIGDSGNRVILNTYARYLKGPNDRRWRIEHAQVVDPADIPLFSRYSIIPSVQPTHATSDMYWAGERLGPERVETAYAFRDLLGTNGWIPLGTDFPVEDISPFKTFYAAVYRRDAKGFPDKGFQMSNALSREQALRGMTIWAARSNFEEGRKGSLEKGKAADFIVLDRDLMTAEENELLGAQVKATYVNGEKVYSRQ